MSQPRRPARPAYDALVDLAATPDGGPCAYVLVKFTFDVAGGAAHPAAAEPLLHDLRDPQIKPRVKAGSDFWVRKTATDVVVQGAACAPGGTPVRAMAAGIQVGNAGKRLAVFGRRQIEWGRDGRPRIPEPEPFVEMPLTYENAYGGIDWRVPVPEPQTLRTQFILEVDHPGLYPRNPFGKGYLIEPGVVPDMELPNLEDPNDLLTAERLIVGDPQHWYRQPIPWCLDWLHPICFPRHVFFGPGVDAWYPGPEDETMPEVRQGFLMAGYRTEMAGWDMARGAHPWFYQEASLGLVLGPLGGGETMRWLGLHHEEPVIQFRLPRALLSLEIKIDNNRYPVEPRLHSVVCRPLERKLNLVYAGHCPLPRTLLPGIHKYIPVAASVNQDAPVTYEAPPTVHERLAAAKEKARS